METTSPKARQDHLSNQSSLDRSFLSIGTIKPLVSVLIVNWNGAKILKRCLASLKAQTFKDFEIIVIDNGSTDGSTDGLEGQWAEVQEIRVIRLKENLGFAAANNVGARLANGQWIALLNNDAFPFPGWLKALVLAMGKYPDFTFFASCQIMSQQSGIIDGMGDVYHVSGMAWRRGYGRPLPIPDTGPEEVFGPCAAAAMYRRDIFLEAGGFDEDFFCYHEDVDLAFRLRLRGNRCLYLPEAVVEHVGSSSQGNRSDFVIYHGHRNLCWTFHKNMPAFLLLRFLPDHLLFTAVSLIFFTLKGHGRAIWKAKWDACCGFPKLLKKRKQIQKERRISFPEIRRMMNRQWINPYLVAKKRR